jgi:hypothetical protein
VNLVEKGGIGGDLHVVDGRVGKECVRVGLKERGEASAEGRVGGDFDGCRGVEISRKSY